MAIKTSKTSKIKSNDKEDKSERKVMRCGCVMKKVVNVVVVDKGDRYHKGIEREMPYWELTEYCKQHQPDYQKKANKFIHLKEKSERRNKYLKWLANVLKSKKLLKRRLNAKKKK